MRRFVFSTLALAGLTGSVLAQTGGTSGAGQGAAGQGAKGQGTSVAGQASPGLGGINKTPWFQDPAIRRELGVDEQQFRRLSEAHAEIFGRFQDRLSALDKLNEAQRAERLRELSRTFNTDANRAAVDILQEQQRQRFNQLFLQQQGFSAFTDPQLQRDLSLSEQQLQQLRKFGDVFDRDMQGIVRDPASADAARRYDALMKSRMDQINSVMNAQQQQAFQRMMGQPFNFPRPNFTPQPPQR
jgi:hypothetical protein